MHFQQSFKDEQQQQQLLNVHEDERRPNLSPEVNDDLLKAMEHVKGTYLSRPQQAELDSKVAEPGKQPGHGSIMGHDSSPNAQQNQSGLLQRPQLSHAQSNTSVSFALGGSGSKRASQKLPLRRR